MFFRRDPILACAIALAAACTTADDAPTAQHWAGCYSLEFGQWTPALPQYSLPHSLELRDTVIAAPDKRLAILARDPPRGLWEITPDHRIDIWFDPPWPNGIKLELRPRGNSLRGDARWYQDVKTPNLPRAPVLARKVQCGAAA